MKKKDLIEVLVIFACFIALFAYLFKRQADKEAEGERIGRIYSEKSAAALSRDRYQGRTINLDSISNDIEPEK